MRVSTTEFVAHFGEVTDRALIEPVTITKDGRDLLVVISAEDYAQLKRRNRWALAVEEMSETELAMIAKAEVPAEHEHLDVELERD